MCLVSDSTIVGACETPWTYLYWQHARESSLPLLTLLLSLRKRSDGGGGTDECICVGVHRSDDLHA